MDVSRLVPQEMVTPADTHTHMRVLSHRRKTDGVVKAERENIVYPSISSVAAATSPA